MKNLPRSLVFAAIPAILAALALSSCEDDPILAPQKGGKTTNGSYGNIAVAPPLDSTATADDTNLPVNPEVY